MFTALHAARSLRILRVFHPIRCASTEVVASNSLSSHTGQHVEAQSKTESRETKSAGRRPHLGIEVDPSHGLWGFFRKKVDAEGKVSYETIEPRDSYDESGRSWTASELRRKSFKDLHTLWYVLLRERNVLATQKEEARRLGIRSSESLAASVRDRLCRKSMARLKYVINERRVVYEKILAAGEEPAKGTPPKTTDPWHRVKGRRRALPREVR
ncbi:hypothetical protein ID866_3026 [Astraeus odoratus]|nr:hypothetical protein ID866_3026 [Astraeus odoratus]